MTEQRAPGTIAANLAQVRRQIAEAAGAAERPAGDITLVAVSKTHPADSIAAAFDCGQRVFGENRVQEAAAKFPELKAANPGLVLHLIGPLQTNKAREAVAGSWSCSNQRATDELGYLPAATLDERLHQTCDWYKSQGWI